MHKRRHRPPVSRPNYQRAIFIRATYIPYVCEYATAYGAELRSCFLPSSAVLFASLRSATNPRNNTLSVHSSETTQVVTWALFWRKLHLLLPLNKSADSAKDWNQTREQAITQIKDMFRSPELQIQYNSALPLVLHMNASDFSLVQFYLAL